MKATFKFTGAMRKVFPAVSRNESFGQGGQDPSRPSLLEAADAPKNVPMEVTVRLKQRKHVQRQTRLQQVSARIFLVIMSILFLLPFYWMLITALKSNAELALTPPTLFPRIVAWGNFVTALVAIPFTTYFLNTVIITLCNVLGSICSNLVIAYGFACLEWPGRNTLFYLVVATIFIPFPIAIIPEFDLFAWLHWINTFLPLVVPAFLGNAFYIFLLRQFLLQIPRDLLDAARIDGASEWRILWQIVAPLTRAPLAAVAIFSAIGAWNDFLGPLIYLQDDTLHTLSIGIQAFRSTHDVQFNILMAASLLVVLPIILLFFLCQRFFIKGITIGGIH